jgi:hypothetical protein
MRWNRGDGFRSFWFQSLAWEVTLRCEQSRSFLVTGVTGPACGVVLYGRGTANAGQTVFSEKAYEPKKKMLKQNKQCDRYKILLLGASACW